MPVPRVTAQEVDVFGRKLAIDDELYEKLKQCSETAGYSSPQEFALHVLEREADRILNRGTEPASEPVEERGEEPVDEGEEEPAKEPLPKHAEGTGEIG